MISNMERVTKHGPMEANSTDTMSIPRNKAKASTFGQMATSTQEIGKITLSQEKVSTSGTTAEFTSESGRTTLCTAREPTSGLMVGCTMAAIRTTKRMASVFTSGSMGELTSVTGVKENRLVNEFTSSLTELSERDYTMVTPARSGSLSLSKTRLNASKNQRMQERRPIKSLRKRKRLSKSFQISRRQRSNCVTSMKRKRFMLLKLNRKWSKL